MIVAYEEVYPIMLELWKSSKQSVFATSVVKVVDFWFRGGGRKFLEENFSAVERGVKITRVFIVEDIRDITPQFRELIERQVNGGITVKMVLVSDLAPDLLYDMALIDERYVEYLNLLPGSKEMRGASFYNTDGQIRKALEIRSRILNEAEDAVFFLEQTSEKSKTGSG
jgi:hypothetical protein